VKARALIYPRREVLDPQAKAIHQALVRIGFDDVVAVHAGKAFEIEVDGSRGPAEARVSRMCERLLANLVVEDFDVETLVNGSGKLAGARAAGAKAAGAKAAGKKAAGVAAAGKPAGKSAARPAAGKAKGGAGTKKPQAPAAEDPTGGTAGGKPVPAKAPGTTAKVTPAGKGPKAQARAPKKGARP
jgi:phosphoribosylformylglycinamidine synthase